MNIVSAGASAVPGADDVKSLPVSASERLEVLAIKGTKLLHSLANTASSILAVASAKPGDDPYLSPELLKLSPAERHHKLCEQYINHSQELKSIVMQCGQLEPAAQTEGAPQEGTPPSPEEQELRARVTALRQAVMGRNTILKQLMDRMAMLLDDMTMWECCARDAQKPPPAES